MDDKAMMAMQKRDEEQWYGLLIDRYTPYVTAIIGGMAKGSINASDIEELAADVFFKIWRRRADIRPGSIKAYIARVARTTCIDRLRTKGIDLVPYDDDILQVALPEQPEEAAIAREQAQIVKQAVNAFGEPDREIFVRYYFFGESIQAISGRLQLNASTTKTKLHRLRAKLRDIMQKRGYGRA